MKRKKTYLTKEFVPTTKEKAELVKTTVDGKIVFGVPVKEKGNDNEKADRS